MQRAAAGLAATCARLLGVVGNIYGSRVVVLTGSGDNGGDALYAGALLARRGAAVTAVAGGSRTHEGGAGALVAAGGGVIGAADRQVSVVIDDADLIIDGMLGIGGKGGLREPYAGLAAQANGGGALVVATDLPSGIDADDGTVDGPAIRADVTVTFGTFKPGLLIDPGASHAGVVELIDIGLGPYLDEPDLAAPQHADIAATLPRPGAESDKYRRGVVGMLAGSARFTGAALLATGGAVRGGAGMVRLVTAEQAAVAVRQVWPEVVITLIPAESEHPEGSVPRQQQGPDADTGTTARSDVIDLAGRVQAWVAGPGMGTGADAAGRLAAVLRTDLPVLVDADGLTLLAQQRGMLPRAAPTLITPHAGELARLLGADRRDVEARRLEHARRAAAELGVTVLLKGSTTVIVSPGGGTDLVNPTGTPWLATAGSGDVLSGLAGALLAQGLGPAEAGLAGAYLHGLAARLAAAGAPGPPGGGSPAGGPLPEAPIGASDVVRAIPSAFRALD
jgi:hydroxyethylthiazole kinase-like uncharacterized protein yjeF